MRASGISLVVAIFGATLWFGQLGAQSLKETVDFIEGKFEQCGTFTVGDGTRRSISFRMSSSNSVSIEEISKREGTMSGAYYYDGIWWDAPFEETVTYTSHFHPSAVAAGVSTTGEFFVFLNCIDLKNCIMNGYHKSMAIGGGDQRMAQNQLDRWIEMGTVYGRHEDDPECTVEQGNFVCRKSSWQLYNVFYVCDQDTAERIQRALSHLAGIVESEEDELF